MVAFSDMFDICVSICGDVSEFVVGCDVWYC